MNSIKNNYFENFIEELLVVFGENISKEDFKELSGFLTEKMRKKYEKLMSDAEIFAKKKALLDKIKERELKKWENISLNDAKSLLLFDENYNKLLDISNKAFNLAKNRARNEVYISLELAEEMKSQLREIYEKVEPYNKYKARMILSESVLDFNYASTTTNISSLRIGNLRRDKLNVN